MAYEPKDNTGALFKNDNRKTDNQPNMRGTATIDGVDYWVSAWTKEAARGKNAGQRFQSLAFERKQQTTGDNDPPF